MAELRIYNTNKIQVYPDEPVSGGSEKIQDVVNNAIEYLIDTTEGRIISLVRADAPQVEGRDKANFYVEFKPDHPGDLPTQLVSRLNQHESDTDWDFYKNEPRWRIPWSIAEYEFNTPGQLEYDIGRLLAIEKLVQDTNPLDLGFSSYDYAAAVINYYLARNLHRVTFAVATNGRKKTIRSAEMVLQPGSYDNFECLNGKTENLISDQLAELRATAESYYIDISVQKIKSVENAVETSPIQVLKDIDTLFNYMSNDSAHPTEDSGFNADEVQSVISRTETLRTGGQIGSGPDSTVLRDETRKRGITTIASTIKETRASLLERVEELVLERVNRSLNEVADGPVDPAYDAITTLETRIFNRQFEDDAQIEGVDNILSWHEKVDSVDIEKFSNESLLQSIYKRIKQTKDQIKKRKLSNCIESIDSWKMTLPTDGTPQSREIAVYTEKLESAFINFKSVKHDSDSLTEPLAGYNTIVKRARSGSVLDEQQQSKLSSHFEKRMEEYRHQVREVRMKSLQREFSNLIRTKAKSISHRQEFEILERVGYAINLEYPPKHDYYNDFRALIKNVARDQLLSSTHETALKKDLKGQLEDRREKLKQEYINQIVTAFNNQRDEFTHANKKQGGIQFAVAELGEVREYMRSRDAQMTLREVSADYESNLRQLKYGTYDILDESEIRKIRQRVAKARKQKVRDLRSKYKAQIVSELDVSLYKLSELLNARGAITLFRQLKSVLNQEIGPRSIQHPQSHSKEARVYISQFGNAVRKLNGNFEPDVNFTNRLYRAGNEKYLESEERNRIRTNTNQEIEKLIAQTQDGIIDRFISEFVDHTQRNIIPDNGSIKKCANAAVRLREVINYLESSTIEKSLTRETREYFKPLEFEILTDSQKSQYHERLSTKATQLLDQVQTRQRKKFTESFETVLENVEQDPSLYDRILAYHELLLLLRQSHSHEFERVPSELRRDYQHLPERLMIECRETQCDRLEERINQQTEKMIRQMEQSLEEESKDLDNRNDIVGNFKDYVAKGKRASFVHKLSKNCEMFDRYEALRREHGVISHEQYKHAIDRLKTKSREMG